MRKGKVIGSSGTTIATGFDIGKHSEAEIKAFDFGENIQKLVLPYANKSRQTAIDFIAKNPLTITDPQAALIDQKVTSFKLNQLIDEYNSAAKLVVPKIPKSAAPPIAGRPATPAPSKPVKLRFQQLPQETQTAMYSYMMQNGINGLKTSKLWKQFTSYEWENAIKTLENKGGISPTRRKEEAGLIKFGIGKGVIPPYSATTDQNVRYKAWLAAKFKETGNKNYQDWSTNFGQKAKICKRAIF